MLSVFYAECLICCVSYLLSVLHVECHFMLSVLHAVCLIRCVSHLESVLHDECHFMLSVTKKLFAECRYAECRGARRRPITVFTNLDPLLLILKTLFAFLQNKLP